MSFAKYPKYKDSRIEWLGDVPENWDVIPFAHAVEFQEGPGIMASDFCNDGVPLLRVSGVQGRWAKPALAMNDDILARYGANRLRVIRHVRYSQQNENSIDLVLFLNGIPVATVEMKTDFTQSIKDAIDQYYSIGLLDYITRGGSSATTTILSKVTFREAIWLFPPAFTLHVLEEWPRFTNWAKRYASPLFTQRDYNTIHVAGIIVSLLFTMIVWRFPNRAVVFVFFAFIFAPSLFFNTLFHAGATVVTHEYCPGVITALTLYLPIFFVVSSVAWRENLLDLRKLIAVLIVAGSFHIWEVGHNVFKAW